MRKPTIWVPTRSNTNQPEAGQKLEISDLRRGIYSLYSENEGADQLRGSRKADLRLCFPLCKLFVFSHMAKIEQEDQWSCKRSPET